MRTCRYAFLTHPPPAQLQGRLDLGQLQELLQGHELRRHRHAGPPAPTGVPTIILPPGSAAILAAPGCVVGAARIAALPASPGDDPVDPVAAAVAAAEGG